MKKGSALYDYLELTGILANGTPEQIKAVKKEYWKAHRKAWRKHQRERCKSCTIFFSPSEYKIVCKAIVGKKNVAGFVKEAALNTAQNKESTTKEIVGKVREQFFAAYEIVSKREQHKSTLDSLLILEQNVLNLIK